jgi:hypothetical protein
MYGTTTVNNLEIEGNLFYNGHMLTLCGETTSTPCIVQDAGNVSFGLAIIIVLLMVAFTAFVYNTQFKKRSWR